MGLYITMYNFFCKILALSLGEQTGIVASELYGARKYTEMKHSFVYSMMTATASLIVIVLPIYFFSYDILSLIGVEHVVASLTSTILYISLPIALVTVYGEQVKAYCYSQGIEDYFGYINIVSFVITSPLMYVFMVSWDLEIYGFIYARIIGELFNFAVYIAIYYKRGDERVIGFEKPPMDVKTIATYFLTCIKFAATNYVESIGFEVNTIYVGLLSDTKALAAYVLWVNVVEIVFLMGIGLSNVVRTRINTFFGMKKISTARNFFWWFFRFNIGLGLIMGISVSLMRNYIAHLYSDNEGITSLLSQMLMIWGLFSFLDFNITTIMTAYRSLGIVSYLIMVDIIVYLPLVCILSYVGLFVFKFKIWFLMVSFACSQGITVAILVNKLRTADWSRGT